jgi:hypothetical protein
MPSAVDICNTALSHLGEEANLTSIDPPEGSAYAGYCAQFYPLALAAALELGSWGFATRRIALAEVDNPASSWLYAYAAPDNTINALAVLPPDAPDDYTANVAQAEPFHCPASNGPNPAATFITPQPFVLETASDGSQIILTNVENAVLRYTTLVDDPNQFTPLFTMALSFMLASLLAGPIIKGDSGTAKSAEMLQKFQAYLGMGRTSDANQRRVHLRQAPSWMAGR